MCSDFSSSNLLKQERDRFVAFAFTHADILIELDDKGYVVFADGATAALLGVDPDGMIGLLFNDLIRNEERDFFEKITQPSASKTRFSDVKMGLKRADSGNNFFSISGYAIPYLKNHLYLTLSRIKDSIPAQDLGQRDGRTGLLNRDAFAWQVLNSSNSLINSEKLLLMSIFSISTLIDEAQHSQSERDEITAEICEFIRNCSVDKDSAGIIEEGKIGVIHNRTITAEEIAGSLISIADGEKKLQPHDVIIESAELDAPSLTEEESAKAILYTLNHNPHLGMDGIASLQKSYRLMLGDTVKKISEFKRVALEKDFRIAFQPIVKMGDSSINHYEALVRLNDNRFKNPFDFITFGEQSGFVPEFDLAMCQKSFDAMKETNSSTGQYPKISLNLSGISLASDLFREALLGILKKNPEQNGNLLFEVTESAKIADLDSTNRFIQELRSMGNKCCIDDFGSGESTFDYLRRIELDYLKIEGAYVKDCDTNHRNRHLLKAITSISKDLGIEAIAEMIETQQVANIIKAFGIEFGQGYFYGKPAENLITLIQNNNKNIPKNTISAKKITDSQRSWWRISG